jgi:hypothetical protein
MFIHRLVPNERHPYRIVAIQRRNVYNIADVFDSMHYDSDDLNARKQKVGFRRRTGKYQIKCATLTDVDSFREGWRDVHDNVSKTVSTDPDEYEFALPRDLLHKYSCPVTPVEYYSTKVYEGNDMNISFLHSLLEDIKGNLARPKNSYRSEDHVK